MGEGIQTVHRELIDTAERVSKTPDPLKDLLAHSLISRLYSLSHCQTLNDKCKFKVELKFNEKVCHVSMDV